MSELRMDAYYYEFDKTGDPAIDRILSAIACAGKAFHHTDQWTDEVQNRPKGHVGATPVDWMQNAAQYAADELSTLRAANRELVEAHFCQLVANFISEKGGTNIIN